MSQTKAQLIDLGTAVASSTPVNGPYVPASNTVAISTNSTERLRVDSSGRLLVGTSSTSAFDNNAAVVANFTHENSLRSHSSFISHNTSNVTGSTLFFGRSRSGSVGGRTIVNSGDHLGRVSFQGADGGAEFVEAAFIQAEVDGTPGTNDMPGRLVFSVTRDGQASPTEAARINNLGAFKATTTGSNISTGNSTHELLNANTSEEYGVRIRQAAATSNVYPLFVEMSGQSPNNATSRFITCADASQTRAEIRSNGGLANYSANNANLSDRNAKKDITPAADTWDCIKEWEIVNYRYKDQPNDADLNLGVIAQQVAESCPEVITVFEEAKDDQPERLGVKEQQMYWMAIKALQEAQVRIEQLEARLTAAGIE